MSALFAVPLTLAFGLPAVLFLWVGWLAQLLNHWLIVVALLLMGLELGFLLNWPIGAGIAFFALYFLLWSWLHTFQLRQGLMFWLEMLLPISFLIIFAFSMSGSAAFWSMQIVIVLAVQLLRLWRRRIRVWPRSS
jgi:hypothetical protein